MTTPGRNARERGPAGAGSQRWLVTGACGQLGGHVSALLSSQGEEVLGLGRHPCARGHGPVVGIDLTAPGELSRILRDYAPTHILHLAGVASPVKVEEDPDGTWAVYVSVPRQLASFAAETGGWMLYPSTDFLWDGKAEGRYHETDPTSPTTRYGRYKRAGEEVTLASGAGAVVRLSLLVGFPVCPRPTTWTRLASAMARGEAMPVCDDEFRSPLAYPDAAALLVELGRRRITRLLQAAGPEVLSTYELMTRFAAALDLPPNFRPISRRDLPAGSERPRMAALDGSTLVSLLPGYQPRPLSVDLITELVTR